MKSYTLKLIEETFKKVQEYYYLKYIDDLKSIPVKLNKKYSFELRSKINSIFNKTGLHLTYKSTFEKMQSLFGENMGKWTSIGTLFLALNKPELFDEVREILSDKESKEIFNWILKFRIAYAFLGQIAEEIFPPKIKKEEFLNKRKLLNYKKGIVKFKDFSFKSDFTEIIGSWIFEQYALKGKVEIERGDYIIDGGAYKGETSFWFLSKGAYKVFAFEPDPYNFEVLCENIKINKVENKIIPINKTLSNKVSNLSLYVTGSGGSTLYKDGNFISQSITIDSFIKTEKIEKINYIKLDVEGAEMKVLEGTIETIKNHKPKLAISVYHRPDDIINIVKLLYILIPESKFYLSHNSYNISETILFVKP